MKRLLILPAVAVVCTAEIWRRGFGAPLIYGIRAWSRAVLDLAHPETEPDPIA